MIYDVSILDPSKEERWDPFVTKHPFGWICHTRAWKEILETSFNHIRAKYLSIQDKKTGQIKAALPLCHVESWLTGNRLVSLPFATLCDPLVSSVEEFKVLSDAAIALKEKLNCRCIEIRAFQAEGLFGNCQMSMKKTYKHHYLTLNEEPEQLMKHFHRTSVRQRIQRAEKSGLEVYTGKSETDVKEFYHLYLKTRRRLCLPPQPYSFIQTIWQKLYPRDSLTLFLTKKDDQTVGGIILFKFKDRVSAEYSVLDEEFSHLNPNHLLFWTAIKMAHQEGFSIFDFGRTATAQHGLVDFKARWGTVMVDLIQLFYPVSVSYQLADYGSVARKLIMTLGKRVPVRAFGALGNFFYRHLG